MAETKLDTQNAEEFFRAGVTLLRRGRDKEALRAFRRARDLAPGEPVFTSFYGMCLATVGGQPRDGVRMCKHAADEEFYRPELYLNLGKAQMAAGNHQAAQEAFREGLSLDPQNRAIVRELERMGIRRRPLFPFLNRRNPLNRWPGVVRHRIGGQGSAALV